MPKNTGKWEEVRKGMYALKREAAAPQAGKSHNSKKVIKDLKENSGVWKFIVK